MEKKWWHKSTVYQVYPKSFCDTTGNGSGDLRGIITKLDYIAGLGVDIIWLSPVYASPMDDNGYDISDYRAISPEFGTMEDMEELILKAKEKGIRILMDLVVNHTSDEHIWFTKSKQSIDNPYRDFYIWRNPVDNHEPNDVSSFFSGSAWQLDPNTNAYYLHLFSKKQPDLNWDNPILRQEIYDMMNFWIAKGIGGFRMDVIDLIGKDIDNKILGNTENTHRYIQEMNKNTFGNKDLFTVGETGGVTIETAPLFSAPNRNELSTVFQFEHIGLDEIKGKCKWDLKPLCLLELKQSLSKWQTQIGDGWTSLFWSNHDQPRALSRWGNDTTHRVVCAKMMATLLHFMKGTPYIYQGEEIGMTNISFENIEDYRDIESINLYKERLALGYDKADIMHSLITKGRDNARTPMQWNASVNAGFTTGTPWLKVNENHTQINVQDALQDTNSIYYYYKKLIAFRKQSDTVIYGDYQLILESHPQIFAYTRKYEKETILVVCNFSEDAAEFQLPTTLSSTNPTILFSNYERCLEQINRTTLQAYESFAIRL